MKKLLASENIGGRIQKWWAHFGDDGRKKITVETVQEIDPIFDQVRRNSETAPEGFHFRGTIPATLIDEICKIKSADWGLNATEAYAEIMGNKTDRAKAVWKMLLEDIDYRKLQAV